ncbi:MAG: hypothetical protein JWO78_182 [Micavibrio sp.]|nr:hypothetical protein [Micavibrio sp.]
MQCLTSLMEKDLSLDIGRRIKEALKLQKKTQAWLAAEVGMKEGYLSELMTGKEGKRWNIDHIATIAGALGIPEWYLLVDVKTVIDTKDREIISRYAALSDDLKRAVDAILFGK